MSVAAPLPPPSTTCFPIPTLTRRCRGGRPTWPRRSRSSAGRPRSSVPSTTLAWSATLDPDEFDDDSTSAEPARSAAAHQLAALAARWSRALRTPVLRGGDLRHRPRLGRGLRDHVVRDHGQEA